MKSILFVLVFYLYVTKKHQCVTQMNGHRTVRKSENLGGKVEILGILIEKVLPKSVGGEGAIAPLASCFLRP